MKYLITGGAGFIGSHLAESLIARGNQVIILDNLSTGSVKNLEKIKGKIELNNGEILDQDLVSKLVAESDYVVHLAAALGVFNIVNKPLESLKTNLQGSEVVLEACDKYRKPVLIASTSEIYGKNDKVPLNEEDDRIIGHPLKSRWSYSEAKAVDESLAYFYYLENKLPIRIVRFFNTVGPRQVGHYGMVVPRFVGAALKNEPLSVYGSGNQIRCFCHIDDAVRALLLVMDSDKAIGEVFNVGNNQQISILELAKKVIEITGSTSTIEKIAYEKAYPEGFEDMQRRVPDISKINQVLGWSPEINLDQIIKDIAAFNSK
ncbi:UDP-glucose 4-epimerase [Candidatus Nanopelagicus hibericus]|uniref:UDP-glucuronate decarboxylase n=1 Tax=Candidatus Nanopelagicus hibericus TaxID=1884915 RepID=A0A249KAI5_9ACTN|nr:GDP-mannose 4,6-dehydratase [Candidatus Nanopelagicus hibericus]ASY13791.1 UDP-glucose 4-epimerase [Candidatus Nanopelagicus hibericus]